MVAVQMQNRNHRSPSSFLPSSSEPYSYQSSKKHRTATPLSAEIVQGIQQPSFLLSVETNSEQSSPLFGNVDSSKTVLEFVHITKNGGTAIESAGGKAGIPWGVCHFESDKYVEICSTQQQQPPYYPSSSQKWEIPKKRNYPSPNFYSGEPWHCPPQWFVPNPYEQSAQFVVIRNPYDRVISEYHCPAWGRDSSSLQDPVHFNTWIQYKLEDQTYHGHMLPQWMYVYDMNQQRIMQHVLRYERLAQEFPRLMKLYHLEHVILPAKETDSRNSQSSSTNPQTPYNQEAPTSRKTTTDSNASTTEQQQPPQRKSRMTIADMTVETVQMINQYYQKDFELFGYQMIPV